MGPTTMEDNGKKKEKKKLSGSVMIGSVMNGADGGGDAIGDEWRR